MKARQSSDAIFRVIFFAALFLIAVITGADAEKRALLTGKAAMGDWTNDAPGVTRKITVQDLPPPSSNVLAINRARVVARPAEAQPKVPPGFKIELYATGFRDPRFLLTAPNGDIFVVESRANQIKVLRDTNGDAKPDVTEIFAERGLNKPFGIAFYPPGGDPQFLYVGNTDGVIRFPYRNGDLKARGPAQQLAAHLSPGGLLRGGGHWTRCIVFSPDGKKCTCRSARARMCRITPRKKIARAFSSLILTAADKRFTLGEFATQSVSRFGQAQTSFG